MTMTMTATARESAEEDAVAVCRSLGDGQDRAVIQGRRTGQREMVSSGA